MSCSDRQEIWYRGEIKRLTKELEAASAKVKKLRDALSLIEECSGGGAESKIAARALEETREEA